MPRYTPPIEPDVFAVPPVASAEGASTRNRMRAIWDGRPPILPARVEPAALRDLYRQWLVARHGHVVPLAEAMTGATVEGCRDHLAMAEIEAPFQVRYRSVGAALVRLYGKDPTGTTVEENFTPRLRREVLAAYRACVEEAQPLYKRRRLFGLTRRFGYHRLMLPLTAAGERIDRVLVAISPVGERLRTAADWQSSAAEPEPKRDHRGDA